MKARNANMTKHCGHKEDGMCDYCLVAYGQHGQDEERGKRGRKSHTLEGKRYVCGECK